MGSHELSSSAFTRVGTLSFTITDFSLHCHLQFIPDIVYDASDAFNRCTICTLFMCIIDRHVDICMHAYVYILLFNMYLD